MSGRLRSPVFVFVALMMVATQYLVSASPQNRKAPSYGDDYYGEHSDTSNKFTFVRVMFGPVVPGQYLGDGPIGWSHDYPEAGIHFGKILSEVSKMEVALDQKEYIFSFTDPNLFKYPFAYLCEVGHMSLSDEEIAGMREYVLRGGFLLIDDFRGGNDLQNLAYYLKRALPEYEMKPLDLSHPIFNCFFSIKSLDVRSYGRLRPEFLGIEDKHGRLMMIINYNYDVSDYWQWSNDPFQPIEDTNEAYKFGVNYVFYALTH
ncbi:MAG TPA: DUF4159 domain-containing protein [Blastocatellia bacterium]|nr:DUF4159 domain-containing protein [Blastocatellia bacterium]